MAASVEEYNIRDFLRNPSIDYYCIPELQRDYVWGDDNVTDLLIGIQEEVDNQDGEYNIGFISAYRDPLNKNRYMLIDGQQRVTTTFLLLFVLQLFKNPKDLYNCDYLFKKSKKTIRLDYKVRDVSHIFLKRLFEYGATLDSIDDFNITNQRWYNNVFDSDSTVIRILSNLTIIINFLRHNTKREIFYNYVLNNVKLLFYPDEDRGFDCESVYIYLNGRGKKLESNEILKALYLNGIQSIEEKNGVGKKWEDWQDFFWKKAIPPNDADKGFNLFLRRIEYINKCINATNINDSPSKFSYEADFKMLPDIYILSEYFKSYCFILDNLIEDFKEDDDYIHLHKSMIREFHFLPSLYIETKFGSNSKESLFRFIRFFYNVSRRENVEKSIATTLPQSIRMLEEYLNLNPNNIDVVDLISLKGKYTSIINAEERLKLSIYQLPPDGSTRTEIEKTFWMAEDFNYKIITNFGSIEHLINWSSTDQIFSYSSFNLIWDNYKFIFENFNYRNEFTQLIALYFFLEKKSLPEYSSSWKGKKLWPYNLALLSKSDSIKKLCTEFSLNTLSTIKLFKEEILNPSINNFVNQLDQNKIQDIESEMQQVLILWIISYKVNESSRNKIDLWFNGDGIGVKKKEYSLEEKSLFNKPSCIYSINYNFIDSSESWNHLLMLKGKISTIEQIDLLLKPI